MIPEDIRNVRPRDYTQQQLDALLSQANMGDKDCARAIADSADFGNDYAIFALESHMHHLEEPRRTAIRKWYADVSTSDLDTRFRTSRVELRFRAHQGNELALKLYELYLRENADVSYSYTEPFVRGAVVRLRESISPRSASRRNIGGRGAALAPLRHFGERHLEGKRGNDDDIRRVDECCSVGTRSIRLLGRY
jgi:hypothetical protein